MDCVGMGREDKTGLEIRGVTKMECHRCKDREDMEAGKYAGIPFDQTPCAKCQLHEVSLRTMPVNPERPVFVPGGMAPGQTEEGLHVDTPFGDPSDNIVVGKFNSIGVAFPGIRLESQE